MMYYKHQHEAGTAHYHCSQCGTTLAGDDEALEQRGVKVRDEFNGVTTYVDATDCHECRQQREAEQYGHT